MRVITKEEANLNKDKIIFDIKKGAVFIHPTDTIYGLGCNAMNEGAVRELRKMKNKPDGAFSVIAPSRKWIQENCEVPSYADDWLDRLPGPYTLILPLNNKKAIAPSVNNGLPTLGVRIPNHWIQALVRESAVPIITTSANVTGDGFMTSLDDLHPTLKCKVDFALYEGEIQGNPSTLVHLDKKDVLVKKR